MIEIIADFFRTAVLASVKQNGDLHFARVAFLVVALGPVGVDVFRPGFGHFHGVAPKGEREHSHESDHGEYLFHKANVDG